MLRWLNVVVLGIVKLCYSSVLYVLSSVLIVLSCEWYYVMNIFGDVVSLVLCGVMYSGSVVLGVIVV